MFLSPAAGQLAITRRTIHPYCSHYSSFSWYFGSIAGEAALGQGRGFSPVDSEAVPAVDRAGADSEATIRMTALVGLAEAIPVVEARPAIGNGLMEQLLEQLTTRVTKTFGDRLVSVILYGSAASPDYSGTYSDLNILCVLTQVTTAELRDSEPIFQWWRKQGNPSPLLLSQDEVRHSTDCFAIEFHDMRERRKLLAGTDIIESLVVDESFYRGFRCRGRLSGFSVTGK